MASSGRVGRVAVVVVVAVVVDGIGPRTVPGTRTGTGTGTESAPASTAPTVTGVEARTVEMRGSRCVGRAGTMAVTTEDPGGGKSLRTNGSVGGPQAWMVDQ
jgi:hypothetical protein